MDSQILHIYCVERCHTTNGSHKIENNIAINVYFDLNKKNDLND